jgi:uncharacterized protein (TIGR02118 family)
MKSAKLLVAYPEPKDVQSFEAIYQKEHVPMAIAKMVGKTKIVATKVLQSPQCKPQFFCIAEVHFPSIDVLKQCADSDGGKETLAHAVKISSGGLPSL